MTVCVVRRLAKRENRTKLAERVLNNLIRNSPYTSDNGIVERMRKGIKRLPIWLLEDILLMQSFVDSTECNEEPKPTLQNQR